MSAIVTGLVHVFYATLTSCFIFLSRFNVSVHYNDTFRSMVSISREIKKGKVFPYSLPSVGPGADPGVQAVSPQVT